MKFAKFLQIAFLIMLAAGAQPAYSAFWQWSKTASTNGTADPTINWAEGMSPSSVNDSARAMMARTAEFRDDVSGALTSAGSSTAYTLATNQAAGGNGIGSPPGNGQMLSFVAHATNGVTPTMAVDGGTAYPLQVAAGTALPSGTIVLGTPYRMSFNLSSLAWVMEAVYGSPYSVPLGGLLPSTVATPPNSSFILPAGQCISTTTYATYWVAMGSPVPGGCSAGNFAVLDLRGRLPAALDNLNGTAANRLTSSGNGCGVAFTSIGVVCGGESETLTLAQIPAHDHGAVTGQDSPDHTHVIGSGANFYVAGGLSGVTGGGSFNALTSAALYSGTTGGASARHTHSIASAGSSTAHPIVPPIIGVSYFLRVL